MKTSLKTFPILKTKFGEPLFEIAMNGDKCRKFDDENRSTLRKCVHALKQLTQKKIA
jgi:hypothetical protein